MRFTSLAALFGAAVSLALGSFLIAYGTTMWIDNQSSFGFFGLLPLTGLGGLFVFLTLPFALFGFDPLPRWVVGPSSSSGEMTQEDDDQPLFSNKRIMGLSLMITGADWIIFSVIGLWTGARFQMCPYNGCETIFGSIVIWALISIGIAIIAIGIGLVVMSFSGRTTRISKPKGNALEIGIS